MIMIKGDLVYGFSQRGTKEFAALTILRVLYCNALQGNTLSTSLLHTWYWLALQATLQCFVLQHSSLCAQFCAWRSCSVVRVSFWEWISHLDWLHSLPLYPTTTLLLSPTFLLRFYYISTTFLLHSTTFRLTVHSISLYPTTTLHINWTLCYSTTFNWTKWLQLVANFVTI